MELNGGIPSCPGELLALWGKTLPRELLIGVGKPHPHSSIEIGTRTLSAV